jgi:transcriptional regulator with XRE-family HTH domain
MQDRREQERKAREARRRWIGGVIQEWRADAEMTREQLAARVGVCLATIVRWEHGMMDPRAYELEKLEAVHPGLVTALFPAARARHRRAS